MDNKNECTDPVDQIRRLIDEGAPGVLSTIADLLCPIDQPRPDDFAKIVRASNGQQVLFYKESTEEEGNVLHAVVNYDGGQADLKFKGLPDDSFATALDKMGVKEADGVLKDTAPFFGGA